MISDKAAVIEVLEKAQAMVSAGWCQNKSVDVTCVCALGAIGIACDVTPEAKVLSRLHMDVTQVFRSANGLYCIAPWNDARERTQAEVVAAFTKAIEFVRAA